MARTLKKKAVQQPAPTSPELPETVCGRFTVRIDGHGETVCEVPVMTMGRMLGIAFATMTRRSGSPMSVAVNADKAFEVISFDAKTGSVHAKLRSRVRTMDIASRADPDWISGVEAQRKEDERMAREAITRAARYNYYPYSY